MSEVISKTKDVLFALILEYARLRQSHTKYITPMRAVATK